MSAIPFPAPPADSEAVVALRAEFRAFLAEQLKTHLLAEACERAGQPAQIRMQPGYDHSYYFISTFMAEHVGWHAARLNG